jgi:UDP-glucose 4-epimerase
MLTHHRPVPVSPSRVVLLGGRGFIGRALTAALTTAGIRWIAPPSTTLDLAAAEGAEHLAGLLREGDAVVMLSALTPDRGRGVELFMRNLRMAEGVARALERVPPDQVVYVSSDAVYPFESGLVTERSCAQPTDVYGMMHLAREVLLRSTVRAPFAVLRPTLVYGAADPHNSYGANRFRRMARKDGTITLFGEGEETRDHVLVEDVARLALEVLRRRSEGLLNVATGRSVSFMALARLVAARFETPVEIRTTPRQTAVTHRHFDVSALRRAFPEFAFTTLEEGLARVHREALEHE